MPAFERWRWRDRWVCRCTFFKNILIKAFDFLMRIVASLWTDIPFHTSQCSLQSCLHSSTTKDIDKAGNKETRRTLLVLPLFRTDIFFSKTFHSYFFTPSDSFLCPLLSSSSRPSILSFSLSAIVSAHPLSHILIMSKSREGIQCDKEE